MFNRRDDVCCERVYSPWPDLAQDHEGAGSPAVYALEIAGSESGSFDFLGHHDRSMSCAITNILTDPGIWAKSRLQACPSVHRMRCQSSLAVVHVPTTRNPLADFFDLFYIGEGETVYDDLLGCSISEWKEQWQIQNRHDFLHERAAQIPGIVCTGFL